MLNEPLPWYIAGPLIGLMLPLLLLIGNKTFGISSSFRHVCSALLPNKIEYFNYDWRKIGGWNLQLVIGVIIGGILTQIIWPTSDEILLSENTKLKLQAIGINDYSGLVPSGLFSFENLFTPVGFIILVFGGFLVGFGTRYGGGCTSGHAITGLATLQKASLIAVIGFFIGGLITTYLILPNIL